jgi:hypothetical protein
MGEGMNMKKGEVKVKVKENETVKKKCISCEKEKASNSQFYLSNNEFHKVDKRFPVCKVCISEKIDYDNIQTIYDILSQMNRPFLRETWRQSVDEAVRTSKNLFGIYYKNIILNKKELTWKNSIMPDQENNVLINSTNQQPDIPKLAFKVTEEMILRWGQNHDLDSYVKLEEFYREMKKSNKIETHQEETYLRKLAHISLKMDKELEAGNSQQVKQLGDLFSKFMADSAFRASDKTDADKTGGIRNFSTIFSEVEKDDHIPPWEYYRKLKNVNQDIVDKTIMHIENFTLRLNKIERMIEPPDDTPDLEEDEMSGVDKS